MKNVAIISFYSGIVERGVETFACEIGNRLTKEFKVSVIQGGRTKQQKYRIIQINFPLSAPKSSNSPLAKIYLDWQSLKILLCSIKTIPNIFRGKFSVLILLNGGWQVVLFRFISKITRAKIVIPGEAGIGSDDAWNLLFRPDAFVALTQAQTNWAKKLTPEVRLVTIPNGVDLAHFNPKIKPKNLPLEKPIVVCTSALVQYKRVDLTIKAVAKAGNLSLLVLGDGEMKGYIDTLGKRLLGKRYLRKVVPHEEIPRYYRAGKVFTLVSKTEAFGTSYIEAMACNLPVVATCDSSRSEIIGDAGILTNPENINEYAKDLGIASKTKYRNKPYAQSLNFSWNKISEKYSILIKELIQYK